MLKWLRRAAGIHGRQPGGCRAAPAVCGTRGDRLAGPRGFSVWARRVHMMMTPASGPAGPGAMTDHQATLRLSQLLRRPVAHRTGDWLGRLADVIVRLRGADYPLVTGLVATVGGREVFVPAEQVSDLEADPLRLSSAK